MREQESNWQRYGSSAAFSTKSVNLNFIPVACDQKSFPVCGFFYSLWTTPWVKVAWGED